MIDFLSTQFKFVNNYTVQVTIQEIKYQVSCCPVQFYATHHTKILKYMYISMLYDLSLLLLQVSLTTKDRQPIVTKSHCTCKIGLSGACGHTAGVLYQFAKYKLQGLKAIPVDIAKTSQPQTWHVPRGTNIHGKAVQDLIVSGHSKTKAPSLNDAPRTIKSVLYSPVRGQPINWNENCSKLIDFSPDLLVIPAIQETNIR